MKAGTLICFGTYLLIVGAIVGFLAGIVAFDGFSQIAELYSPLLDVVLEPRTASTYVIPASRVQYVGKYASAVKPSSSFELVCLTGTTTCNMRFPPRPFPDDYNVTCGSPRPESCNATLIYNERHAPSNPFSDFMAVALYHLLLFVLSVAGTIGIICAFERSDIRDFFANAANGKPAAFVGRGVVLRYSPAKGLTMYTANKEHVLIKHGKLIPAQSRRQIWRNVPENLKMPGFVDLSMEQIMRMRDRKGIWFEVVSGVRMIVGEAILGVRIHDGPIVEFAFPDVACPAAPAPAPAPAPAAVDAPAPVVVDAPAPAAEPPVPPPAQPAADAPAKTTDAASKTMLK